MTYVYNAKIIRIIDGDTFDAEIDLGFKIWIKDRFRLYGYSAPETHGDEKPFGLIAKRKLESILILGNIFKVTTSKPDKYGRWLVDVFYPFDNFLNNHLVKLGYGVFWDGKSARPQFDFTNYPKE